jgi:hypothetical protein
VVSIDRDAELDESAIARFRAEVDYQRRLSHHPNVRERGQEEVAALCCCL